MDGRWGSLNGDLKGLYYSYYKTLVNAPTVWEGVGMLTHDNVSEYGHTINTLKRFNLYPEVRLCRPSAE